MARAIDIQPIIEEIQSSLEIPSYSEHDKGFDDGLKYVLDLIEKTPILTPPNEPLTLEQLRAQNGALLTAMEAINNAAVEYLERGPYDDGEQTAVLFAQAVNELSRVFVSAPPDRRPPEGEA